MLFKKNGDNNQMMCRCPKCGEKYQMSYKFCPMCAYPNKKSGSSKESAKGEIRDRLTDDPGEYELEMEPEVNGEDSFDVPDIRLVKKVMSPDEEMEKLYN